MDCPKRSTRPAIALFISLYKSACYLGSFPALLLAELRMRCSSSHRTGRRRLHTNLHFYIPSTSHSSSLHPHATPSRTARTCNLHTHQAGKAGKARQARIVANAASCEPPPNPHAHMPWVSSRSGMFGARLATSRYPTCPTTSLPETTPDTWDLVCNTTTEELRWRITVEVTVISRSHNLGHEEGRPYQSHCSAQPRRVPVVSCQGPVDIWAASQPWKLLTSLEALAVEKVIATTNLVTLVAVRSSGR